MVYNYTMANGLWYRYALKPTIYLWFSLLYLLYLWHLWGL